MISTIQDKGGRDYQEDTFAIDIVNKKYLYIGLFDGHGGDKVSVNLRDRLKDILEKNFISNDNVPEVIYKSLYEIENITKEEYCGSTALILIRNNLNNKVHIANVGDCRAILENSGKYVKITEDHNPYLLRELERILQNGGKIIQDSNGLHRVMGTLALTRAIGDSYLKEYITWEPDIYTIELNNNNTFIIMASDGLWDVFKNQEVIDIIMKSDKKEILQDIVNIARQRGSTDNITIILYKLN
jgi:serine/threonine protein phosphatase PrpC